MVSERLSDSVISHLSNYDARISAAGIRYGSVAYIAFGSGVVRPNKMYHSTTHYPIEMEFGADYWEISKDDEFLMDSNFTNIDTARIKIGGILVGRRIKSIDVNKGDIQVRLDDNIVLNSRIVPEPASGFVYSFQAEGESAWETIDGVTARQ